MSDSNKKPSLIAYSVTKGKDNDDKGFWTPIGAAWANSKGGYKIILQALPVNGEIVLHPPKEKEQE